MALRPTLRRSPGAGPGTGVDARVGARVGALRPAGPATDGHPLVPARLDARPARPADVPARVPDALRP
ncbi:FkbM family methyltransferase, partial [Kitasatospora sp. NPDC127111]